ARRGLRARLRERMTWLRTVLAAIGSRLLVRIWLHGILLFAGLIVTIAFARYILPRHDAALPAHTPPRFALRPRRCRARALARPGAVADTARGAPRAAAVARLRVARARPPGGRRIPR